MCCWIYSTLGASLLAALSEVLGVELGNAPASEAGCTPIVNWEDELYPLAVGATSQRSGEKPFYGSLTV